MILKLGFMMKATSFGVAFFLGKDKNISSLVDQLPIISNKTL